MNSKHDFSPQRSGANFSALAAAAAAAIVGSVHFAHAAVTISSNPTQNMICSGGVCAPTSVDAVLNVGDLETLLAAGDVTVTTTGTGVQAHDIGIAAALSWSAASTLALDAHRSITIGAAISVAGAGGISLRDNDHGHRGKITYVGGNITFADLSSSLTINGPSYTLANSIAQLATDIAAAPKGKYALANSYDASADGTYRRVPIPTPFGGRFDGLGNAIENLSINDSTDGYVGLFAQLYRDGAILDIGLPNANITVPSTFGGRGAALVATSSGTIEHSFVTGTVYGSGYAVFLGALVGQNAGSISDSSAGAEVTNSTGVQTGGLVGDSEGTIRKSFATGDVVGIGPGDTLGGLVGANEGGFVEESYATGAVVAQDTNKKQRGFLSLGGLIGENSGWVDKSSATGSVTGLLAGGGGGYLGGIAGLNTGLISVSFETGAVASNDAAQVGGLVGADEFGSVSEEVNCYATGAASGGKSAAVGGFIGGHNSGTTIQTSYSTGVVAGKRGSYVGGFAGADNSLNGIAISYWDTTTSGKLQGTGNRGNEPGLKGETTSQFQSGLPAGFDPAIWAENPDINGGLPYLIANPPH